MEQLIEKFQLNISLLIAQIVNFGILFFVLYKMVYKPILKILDNRREKIEHSLAQAKEIEVRTSKIETEIAEHLQESKIHATQIIKEAKEIGEKTRMEILERTNKEVSDMVRRAKEEIYREKEAMMDDLEKYIVKTSILIVDKVVSQKLDSATKEQIITDAFNDLPRKNTHDSTQ